MNRRISFFGLLIGIAAFSWIGLVWSPSVQVAALVPGRSELRDGKIVTEREVPLAARFYLGRGCAVCHTRQIDSADMDYGWGKRRTGVGEWAAMGIPPEGTDGIVGFSRLGPDLTSLSSRWNEKELGAFLAHHGGRLNVDFVAEWLLQSETSDSKSLKGAKP